MQVHLVDGTYELFRHYFALPSYKTEEGLEVGAVRGVLRSMLSLLENGATHLGVATDHVIESFRNDLWPGYKTSTGVPPDLLSQFPMLEDTLSALGISVWPMDEYEADDALASAAAEAAAYADQVVICTPDKDLAQCVVDCHVVQLDRRSGKIFNEDAVVAKFGVLPTSIPDYLALVGDSADGFPGLPGWGAKSAATVLAKYRHIGAIPRDFRQWEVEVRGAAALAGTLVAHRDLAMLFQDLATLRTSVTVGASVERLRWSGPGKDFLDLSAHLGAQALSEQASALATKIGPLS